MSNDSRSSLRLKYFGELLPFMWLRPENALLVSIRAEELAQTLSHFGSGKDTIDVSCGDGVFSFITLGGKLDFDSDMYRALDNSQAIRSGNHDVFNHFDESYRIAVKERPSRFFEFGTDWKESLLKKAERLNAYSKLLVHDNNQLFDFPSQKFQYVYSNSSYWVKNFESHLQDLARMTKKGGRIVLEMKTKDIRRFTAKNYLPKMGSRFHEIIDAGRLSTWHGLRSKEEILSVLESLEGVRIEQVKPIYGGEMAMIWDCGLRPLFSPLAKMVGELNSSTRHSVKQEWCTIIQSMFSEFLAGYESNENDAIEYIFVLEKI